jgi:hypothetical protein
VSLLQQIMDGSLVSKERLMQARHFYAPMQTGATTQQAFARWTERLPVQSELASARELAGMSDAELQEMEAEFVRSPLRPRSERFRKALRTGAVLAAGGAFGLALQALTVGFGDGGYRVLQMFSVTCLLAAMGVAAASAYVAFASLHLDLSHGTLGLYVGRLDEQHPWLYEAMTAARHPVAEEYRRHVLRDRGPLRGMDFIIMRDIVRTQDTLDRTQWARSVAEALQRPARASDSLASEPRLVHVGSRGDQREGSMARRRDARG